MNNPFTPSFGKVPYVLAGRQETLAEMTRAFQGGPGNPNLSSMFIGPRGMGKTALMACIADEALEHGWITASVSAGSGMLEDVIERTTEAAAEHLTPKRSARIKGVNVAQMFGIEIDWSDPDTGNWRTRMGSMLNALAQHDIGLLIAVDEVRANSQEMVQLASVYQHFVSENRRVALIMAGLPHQVNKLVDHDDVSFLRRARHHHLGLLSKVQVEDGLKRTFEAGGKKISRDALAWCVETSGGFPYMMQLVGFWAWEEGAARTISLDAAKEGARLALADFRTSVLEATYRELSDGDMNFLHAMLPEGEADLATVATRMGKKNNYASKYKARLLERGIIDMRSKRQFGFALPGMTEFLESMDD